MKCYEIFVAVKKEHHYFKQLGHAQTLTGMKHSKDRVAMLHTKSQHISILKLPSSVGLTTSTTAVVRCGPTSQTYLPASSGFTSLITSDRFLSLVVVLYLTSSGASFTSSLYHVAGVVSSGVSQTISTV